MKDYNDFTDDDFREILNGIRKNTTAFDGVEVTIKCIRYELLNILKHDDVEVAETGYFVARLINVLSDLGIYKGERLTDDKA